MTFDPKSYNVGPNTVRKALIPAELTDISDLQAVFNAVEVALTPPPPSPISLTEAYKMYLEGKHTINEARAVFGLPPVDNGGTRIRVDRAEMRRTIESVLSIPSSGHASAGELSETILDALGVADDQ